MKILIYMLKFYFGIARQSDGVNEDISIRKLVCFVFLRLINNLSVIKGQVFLG